MLKKSHINEYSDKSVIVRLKVVRSIETPSIPSQRVDQENAYSIRDAYLSPIVVTPLVQSPIKQVKYISIRKHKRGISRSK